MGRVGFSGLLSIQKEYQKSKSPLSKGLSDPKHQLDYMKRHHYLADFFMPFPVVWCAFVPIIIFKTTATNWLLVIFDI